MVNEDDSLKRMSCLTNNLQNVMSNAIAVGCNNEEVLTCMLTYICTFSIFTNLTKNNFLAECKEMYERCDDIIKGVDYHN